MTGAICCRELVGTRGQGPAKDWQLIEPKALLDEWKKQVLVSRKREIRRFLYPMPPITMLLQTAWIPLKNLLPNGMRPSSSPYPVYPAVLLLRTT